ncbi:hypothetical protein LTR64_005350 [Lithohypha guttulata]|uniref:uncharacterized protein n=1 Tax=Lithohypha guttulata TaxID=1690604 RepID=UPI00315CF408
MAMIMFMADGLIHYTTRTVEVHQAKRSNDIQEFGKGLAQQCLSMDRTANYGLPCTVNNLIPIIDFLRQQNEMLALYHNTSTMSEIRTVEANGQEIAILLPKTSGLSPFVDFRASTIGITTQCRPITHLCNLVPSGIDDMFSQFTCSSNFWGLLGKTTNGTFDPDYPPLSIKANRNIVMAYFMDKNLTVPYNSVGYNPTTGGPDENGIVLPDDQLVNEVHMALAMRFASTAVDADVDLSMDKGFYRGPTGTYDIILSCNYESLHVDYTWFNGTIRDVMTAPAPNGTLSEIWHGRSSPTSVSGDSPTLQTILKQAAVQDSSETFARKWADLFSPVVMATIGGVTSNRMNSLEQIREPTLVVKVSIPALTFLAFWCIVYIIFGTVLMVLALRAASEQDIRDARARLNVYGIVTWAVSLAQSAGREDHEELMPREQNVREERHLVGLLQGPQQNFYYKVFRGGGGI